MKDACRFLAWIIIIIKIKGNASLKRINFVRQTQDFYEGANIFPGNQQYSGRRN